VQDDKLPFAVAHDAPGITLIRMGALKLEAKKGASFRSNAFELAKLLVRPISSAWCNRQCHVESHRNLGGTKIHSVELRFICVWGRENGD
jgi:hypothetical protein